MSYNLFPSMKAIQLYERLTDESFINLEKNPENIIKFIYCCLVAHPENKFKLTFEEACESFFIKNINDLMLQFEKEMNFVNQFKVPEKEDTVVDSGTSQQVEEQEEIFLSSLIPILVSDCGLDINYVMNELRYTEIMNFINYSVSSKREKMEEQRFWTFLQIAPHIDAKKIKGPEDLIEFTWEKDNRKKEAEKKMVTDRQRLIEVGIIKEDKGENKETKE